MIGWLNDNEGFAIVVLTFVLVAVTVWYAWQTRRMVREMRDSRELSVLPHLALQFRFRTPTFAAIVAAALAAATSRFVRSRRVSAMTPVLEVASRSNSCRGPNHSEPQTGLLVQRRDLFSRASSARWSNRLRRLPLEGKGGGGWHRALVRGTGLSDPA
jgi:hypothetical protein